MINSGFNFCHHPFVIAFIAGNFSKFCPHGRRHKKCIAPSPTFKVNIIINRNGSTIEDQPDNLQIDIIDSKIELIFDGVSWRIVSNTGSRGYTGSGGSGSGGASPQWIKVDTTYQINPFENVMYDTLAGSFSIHLPFNPTLGISVSLSDVGNANTNPLTINRNGQTIENVPDNLVIDVYASKIDLIFDGNTWRMFINSGIAR